MTRPVLVPFRTRRETRQRIILLVGFLATLQILLDAAEDFVGRWVMLSIRLSAAGLAALAAIHFETLKGSGTHWRR